MVVATYGCDLCGVEYPHDLKAATPSDSCVGRFKKTSNYTSVALVLTFQHGEGECCRAFDLCPECKKAFKEAVLKRLTGARELI